MSLHRCNFNQTNFGVWAGSRTLSAWGRSQREAGLRKGVEPRLGGERALGVNHCQRRRLGQPFRELVIPLVPRVGGRENPSSRSASEQRAGRLSLGLIWARLQRVFAGDFWAVWASISSDNLFYLGHSQLRDETDLITSLKDQ